MNIRFAQFLTALLLIGVVVYPAATMRSQESATNPPQKSLAPANGDRPSNSLRISWANDLLKIRGDFPGDEIEVLYLEAYCRPGSTDRDWGKTVIGHKTELISQSDDGRIIKLRDRLHDGVNTEHTITAGINEVSFELVMQNPTDQPSEAEWAQPCVRVDQFTGTSKDDARQLVPVYARKCFIFIDGKLTRLPTEPWATVARYTPGQVYCPQNVNRDDVNPRPLSQLVPSHGIMGCYSKDESKILAVAWEPCQELFLGVLSCVHSDFRIGGLRPEETKTIRGKIYLLDADIDQLLKRYQADFQE